jgi:hypothetical protein
MAISALGFLRGMLVARLQGVQDPGDQNKVALVSSLTGNTALGLALTLVVAQREAASEQPPPIVAEVVPGVESTPASPGQPASKKS